MRCAGHTASGGRCRRNVVSGRFCYQHRNQAKHLHFDTANLEVLRAASSSMDMEVAKFATAIQPILEQWTQRNQTMLSQIVNTALSTQSYLNGTTKRASEYDLSEMKSVLKQVSMSLTLPRGFLTQIGITTEWIATILESVSVELPASNLATSLSTVESALRAIRRSGVVVADLLIEEDSEPESGEASLALAQDLVEAQEKRNRDKIHDLLTDAPTLVLVGTVICFQVVVSVLSPIQPVIAGQVELIVATVMSVLWERGKNVWEK